MLSIDRDSLECDLAETYGIYNMKELPASRVALFAMGLREDSRIKKKITKSKVSVSELLLAMIVDRLSLLVWFQTEDGRKNRNRPQSIAEKLMDGEKQKENESFETPEDFRKAWQKIMAEE